MIDFIITHPLTQAAWNGVTPYPRSRSSSLGLAVFWYVMLPIGFRKGPDSGRDT